MAPRRPTERDFRLARLAREQYGLADLTLEPELSTARTIAARLVAGRGRAGPTERPAAGDAQPVSAGELQAAGILVSIFGRLIDHYRATTEPDGLHLASDQVAELVGPEGLAATVAAFPIEFPRHLAEPEPADPDAALAQLLLLGVLSENPAVAPFGELIDLQPLRARAAAAPRVRAALEETLDERPVFPGDPRSLIELLREPAEAAPGSLADQLRYIRTTWGDRFAPLLGDLLDRLLIALDVLAEERHSAELAWLAVQPDAGAGGPARSTPSAAKRSRPSASASTPTGCRAWSSSPRARTSGSTSCRASTAGRSGRSTRSPTRSWSAWPATGSPACG